MGFVDSTVGVGVVGIAGVDATFSLVGAFAAVSAGAALPPVAAATGIKLGIDAMIGYAGYECAT